MTQAFGAEIPNNARIFRMSLKNLIDKERVTERFPSLPPACAGREKSDSGSGNPPAPDAELIRVFSALPAASAAPGTE